MMTRWSSVVGALMLGACGGTAAVPPLAAGAGDVVLRKAEPPGECKEVGPVSVQHGNGCGLYGKRGTYEGAYAALKNKAATMRADYVRMDALNEPHGLPNCYVNTYEISGVAFRCKE